MRRAFVSLILFCAAFAAGIAKPDGAAYSGMSVGKDNLIRICWGYYGGAAGEGFQIETIDSNGNLKKMGPKYGPYAGWLWCGSATGPSNDTVVGLESTDHKTGAVLRLNASNERSATFINSLGVSTTTAYPNARLDGIDSGDLAWFLVTGSAVSDPSQGKAVLRAWPASRSGTVTLAGGYAAPQYFSQLKIRNDGTKCILGWTSNSGTNSNYTYVSYLIPSSGGIFGTLFKQAPMATGLGGVSDPFWWAFVLTTTPDNHFQICWTARERSPAILMHTVIWDVAPDGTIRSSPDYAFQGWSCWDMAASALSGGDGQMRLVYHNDATDQLAILTIDRNSWAITGAAYR